MDADFKGRTVIVTGGSEGVGAATARRFAATGANIVLVARTRKNLDLVAGELGDKTGVLTIAMDVCDHDAAINLFKKAEYEFGAINVLVNNAGYHSRGPVEKVDAADLGKMVDVNLKAPVILSRLAIPYLRQAGAGAIINVGSLAGRTPVPGAATYSASKAGLRAFTYALAEELTDTDIKLAIVSPGPIDTGFIMSNIDIVTDITFSQPMSTADEVAAVIMDLATGTKRERSMPPLSGFLTTLNYLSPGIGSVIRPLLEKKGRRVKRKLKAKMRAQEQES